jgi:ribosomal protein L7/L12
MIFIISETDRRHIVRALAMLAEDLRVVSEAAISSCLRREFENDATTVSSLAGRAAGLAEPLDDFTMNAEAASLLRAGRKIEAIKLVRANRPLALKEAKDYVEALQ